MRISYAYCFLLILIFKVNLISHLVPRGIVTWRPVDLSSNFILVRFVVDLLYELFSHFSIILVVAQRTTVHCRFVLPRTHGLISFSLHNPSFILAD